MHFFIQDGNHDDFFPFNYGLFSVPFFVCFLDPPYHLHCLLDMLLKLYDLILHICISSHKPAKVDSIKK